MNDMIPPLVPRDAPVPVYRFRAKICNYVNEQGHRIEHVECIAGTLPPLLPEFTGTIMVSARGPTTQTNPQGVYSKETTFQIPATSIDEAFVKFDAHARIHIDKMRQSNAQAAREAAAPLLVGPNGEAIPRR